MALLSFNGSKKKETRTHTHTRTVQGQLVHHLNDALKNLTQRINLGREVGVQPRAKMVMRMLSCFPLELATPFFLPTITQRPESVPDSLSYGLRVCECGAEDCILNASVDRC